ncbi:DivIVA domain-containing protein [Bombilactobacillus bombi]|uniref:DivIVA domain-containing protein n=1 Tax=Bombilactobacillus bombi TaxID=1303590 RepID=UPI0015E5E29F|nr:DivIVA domain-containing protein [Bombilactobacillus bombi]
MALTPKDIQEKDFGSQLRGYDKDEVDNFLNQVIADYNVLIKKNQQLAHDLKEAQTQISYFNELQNTVNEAIIVAQNAADQVKNQADVQANSLMTQTRLNTERMVNEAIKKARQIVQEAEKEAQTIIEQSSQINQSVRRDYKNLQNVIESQQKLINSNSWQELINDGEEKIMQSIQAECQSYLARLNQFADKVKLEDDDLVIKNSSEKNVDKRPQNVDNQDNHTKLEK